MKLSRFSVALAALFAFVAVEAFAQVGSVLGRLVDNDGNPVVGAECTVQKRGGGGRLSKMESKDDGSFVKPGLRPGMYSIRCEKEGFRPLPVQVQVSAFGQGDLGEQVMFPMAEGELSEKDHARATTLLAEVNEASESGNDQETLNKLLELYEMMPTSTEILFNIASTYEKMGDTENALEYYTEAAEKNPDLAYDSWLAIGDIHGKAKQWVDATAAMKKAMDIKQTDSVQTFNCAVYAHQAGDVDTASVFYEKTTEIDPNRAIAYYQLGLISVGKAENEAALAHFEKFIALAPDHDRVDEAQGVIDALKAAEERAK